MNDMRKLHIILAILWTVCLPTMAQEQEILVYEGRVVNTQGIPIKDVFVGTLNTNATATTGVDGVFRLELPEKGDSVVIAKRGLQDFRTYLIPYFDVVFILGQNGTSWLPYRDYVEKMEPTAKAYLEKGLNFLTEEGGQDYNKAFACFFRSACMENTQAMYQLGRMYDEGLWATQDYQKAIDWYKKAKNVAEANTRLGTMYEEGTGVEQDYQKAVGYYLTATHQGDTIEARKRAENLYARNLVERPKEDDRILDISEQSAEFPGDIYAWLSQNIKYPSICQEKNIQGRVSLQFVINKDGSITDVKVLRSPDPALAAEAIRLAKIMPKWKPAMQGNKPVRMRWVLPVMFKLS